MRDRSETTFRTATPNLANEVKKYKTNKELENATEIYAKNFWSHGKLPGEPTPTASMKDRAGAWVGNRS